LALGLAGGAQTLPLRGRRFRPADDDFAAVGNWTIPCFVAGPENRLVAAAVTKLLDAADNVPPVPSPLMLLGPSGCGKTHLARGVAEAWHARLGDQQVAYLTASDFCRQVASAISDRSLNDFRNQLRRGKLLVIDDLPRMAGEPYALEELSHTLDALRESGGLFIGTSTKPLAEIPRLGRGLVGRLLSGAAIRIAPLGQSARAELLRHTLDALGCRATDDALQLLAQTAPDSPTRLFGLAIQLRRQLRGGALLDRPLAAELLASAAPKNSPPATDILAAVARYYGLPKAKLTSSSRQQSTVLARAVAIYLIRQLTPLSYDQIGRMLGGRDHTTVLHNFRRIDRGLATDRPLRDALDELRGSITSAAEG
jgi:chromosomal replication initiator protein